MAPILKATRLPRASDLFRTPSETPESDKPISSFGAVGAQDLWRTSMADCPTGLDPFVAHRPVKAGDLIDLGHRLLGIALLAVQV